MGNEISAEEETDFLEEAYAYNGEEVPTRLDNSDVNEKVNVGTSAPNCQPKHTRKDLEQIQQQKQQEGLEVGFNENADNPEMMDGTAQTQPMSAKHRARLAEEEKAQSAADKNKKLSYIQMAKLGYQELVNAIVRPPRADYKVCMCMSIYNLFFFCLCCGDFPLQTANQYSFFQIHPYYNIITMLCTNQITGGSTWPSRF
jgi:hypothetical protein